MEEIKSAWEKAMEKVEKLGKPSAEELGRLEFIPLGNALAVKYLEQADYNLNAELAKHQGSTARKYLIQGIEETLLRNIMLPRDDRTKQTTKRAMSGIKLLKENKSRLDIIFDQINNLFNYYEQARQQSYTQFKNSFEAKFQQATKALQQQLGTKVSINPELQPQFREEWLKISGQLDAQYQKVLEEHKQQILNTA